MRTNSNHGIVRVSVYPTDIGKINIGKTSFKIRDSHHLGLEVYIGSFCSTGREDSEAVVKSIAPIPNYTVAGTVYIDQLKWLGSRKRSSSSMVATLFILSALLLPLSVMAITFCPSDKPLSSVDTSQKATNSLDLLRKTCGRNEKVWLKCGEVFQSSFSAGSSNVPAERFAATDLSESTVLAMRNGFVDTAVSAYNNHHHLVIRPDDVWMAILTQFNLYVNANAEMLRHLFVEHEGQKHLLIEDVGNRYTVHFGKMAEQMGKLIQKNVIDPDLRKWIIPDFSTTTDNDVIVSSVIMMATLKAYFSYQFRVCCGLPAVTLLGEKADWESLLVKAEKLRSYGEETTQWHSLLKPVLAAFVRSFDEPNSDRTKDFWQRIAHHYNGGSGSTYLSGWITAFCFFDKKGKPLYSERGIELFRDWPEIKFLELDGVGYHAVDTEEIPPAYADVDVKLDDNGVEIETVMIAGLVGMEIRSSGVRGKDHAGKDDVLQPVAGWWLCEKQAIDETQTEEYKLEQMLREFDEKYASEKPR